MDTRRKFFGKITGCVAGLLCIPQGPREPEIRLVNGSTIKITGNPDEILKPHNNCWIEIVGSDMYGKPSTEYLFIFNKQNELIIEAI